jgi:EF-hand domain pair
MRKILPPAASLAGAPDRPDLANRCSVSIFLRGTVLAQACSLKAYLLKPFVEYQAAVQAAFVGVPLMLFALGAASSVLDVLQSLATSKSSSTQSATSGQSATDPFALPGSSDTAAGSTSGSTSYGGSRISPETMSALIAAQSQSGSTASSSSSTSPSDALNDLFSQIDADSNGQISKSEFENALGAGETNVAQADDVFNKLDKNGDGSVSLDEMKSALQGAGGRHGGHHLAGDGDANGASSDGSGSSTDPLSGSSSTSVTNSDGSTTTTISYPDGSKVTMTTPASSASSSSNSGASSSATSSYNWIEQMIQREAKAISANASNSLSVAA